MVKEGFILASTFKVFNSLVAHETDVVDLGAILSWDGVVQHRAEFNRDFFIPSFCALGASTLSRVSEDDR